MGFLRNAILTTERFFLYRVLRADDTPHRLALGAAIGVAVAFTPALGFHMIIAVLLARLCRANARIAIPFVWISNPLTLVPIYLPAYWLGHRILSLFTLRPPFNLAQVKHFLLALSHPIDTMHHLAGPATAQSLLESFLRFAADLWLGSTILALCAGAFSYILLYKLILWFRSDHPRARALLARLHRRNRRRQDSP